jgi:hypothetical protein
MQSSCPFPAPGATTDQAWIFGVCKTRILRMAAVCGDRGLEGKIYSIGFVENRSCRIVCVAWAHANALEADVRPCTDIRPCTMYHDIRPCTMYHDIRPCTRYHDIRPPGTMYHVPRHQTMYHVPRHQTMYHVPRHQTMYQVPRHLTIVSDRVSVTTSSYTRVVYFNARPAYPLGCSPSRHTRA